MTYNAFAPQLLDRDPKKRLGSSQADAAEIKAHPFFRDINWEKLLRKELTPPFKPSVQSEMDVSNFDPAFTGQTPHLETVGSHLDSALYGTSQFKGFTFMPDSELGAESSSFPANPGQSSAFDHSSKIERS